MHRKAPKILEDIRDAAAFILEAVEGRTLQSYASDRLRRQAVERNFEIIGEALNRLSRLDTETSGRLGDSPRIISFRNLLIHGYDIVDHEVVWTIIKRDLPELLKRVEQLLADANQAD